MSDPCSDYKFDRQVEVGPWLKTFSEPWNPFGNYHEPLAYPYKRQRDWEKSKWSKIIPEWIWWNLRRNPFHNLTHFWLGITPKGNRYEWIAPECRGWRRELAWDKVGNKARQELWVWRKDGKWPRYHYKWWAFGWEGYIGTMSRGNFGAAFRRS